MPQFNAIIKLYNEKFFSQIFIFDKTFYLKILNFKHQKLSFIAIIV